MEILYRISPEEKIQMFTHDERQVMANAHMAWPGEVMKMFKMMIVCHINMLLNLSVKGDNSLILLITLEILKWEPTNEIKFFMTVKFTHDERQVMANAHMAWPGEVMKMFNIKPYFPLLSK
jgi:cell fate (sporulation/competence/biofilm development) regulator YmcA (YheA/YmcA/DUF963 family)